MLAISVATMARAPVPNPNEEILFDGERSVLLNLGYVCVQIFIFNFGKFKEEQNETYIS